MSSTRAVNKTDFGICMQNRELSWLKFNERVLEESNYHPNPLLERLKFIAIFSSNMDEFYMIRVGSLTDYLLFAPDYYDNKTGMSAQEQLDAVFSQTSSLCALKGRRFSTVMENLAQQSIHHLKMGDLGSKELNFLEKYFVHDILPFLSPQIISSSHPFPHIDNKGLYVAVTLEHKKKNVFGLIAMPSALDRLIFLTEDNRRFVLLEEVIYHFSHLAFNPYKVCDKTVLAVTRNADISIEETDAVDEDIDYRQLMKKLLKKRKRLAPVRLELQYAVDDDFQAFFLEKLNLKKEQVFVSNVPLDLSYCYRLEEIHKNTNKGLVRPAFIPADVHPDRKISIMRLIQKKDLLLSYPYESIASFLTMMRQAAEDPAVLSIKITLYRIDFQSKLAEALIQAAENGKEVIVLMELRARFDEENNIEWAQRLYESGCRVIYGLPDYKVHSKICLITRKNFGKIQYITQIGTGNYNEKTAKLYTDLSLITANQEIGKDAALFFNNLMLNKLKGDYTHLWVAPIYYKQSILDRIETERQKATKGRESRIIIKCNSLTDREIIIKLIEASQSGVKISMIIRGICCLIPGISGFTDNITVTSIIGRFLEHSRIYCFGTEEDLDLYISSSDLMTRNTERRVEIACPVLDRDVKQRIYDMLEIGLKDDTKSWKQFSDGRYIQPPIQPEEIAVNSQEIFTEQARSHSVSLAEHEQTTKGEGFLNNIKSWIAKLSSKNR